MNIACLVSIGTGRTPKISLDKIDISMPCLDSRLIDSLCSNFASLQNLKTILVDQVFFFYFYI